MQMHVDEGLFITVTSGNEEMSPELRNVLPPQSGVVLCRDDVQPECLPSLGKPEECCLQDSKTTVR